jgi:hypothetical protein
MRRPAHLPLFAGDPLFDSGRKATIVNERTPTNEGKSRLSVPPDFGTNPLSEECGDFPLLGVPAQRRLREDEFAVKGDLEPTLRGGQEFDVLDDRRPAGKDLVRQTDGTGNVVSGDAELDGEAMVGVNDHAADVTSRQTLTTAATAVRYVKNIRGSSAVFRRRCG